MVSVISLQGAAETRTVIIVDEVGKMELFSNAFVSLVQELFSSPSATVLATVPVAKQRPIPFVDELKKRKDVTLVEVSEKKDLAMSKIIIGERSTLKSAFTIQCSR